MKTTYLLIILIFIQSSLVAQTEQKALLLPKNENIEQIEKNVLEKELKLTRQIRDITFRLNEIVEEKLPEIQKVEENKYSDYYQPEIVGKDTNKTKSTLGTTYYTRATGNWGTTTTWSTVGCGGAAATSTPGAAAGDVAIICNGHTVTVAANPANPLNAVTVKNGGYLKCGGTGGGANKQFTIASDGTFTIEAGGTYEHNTTNAASTTVFNGTENFDPTSTIIITKWDATTTNLINGVDSDFGNLTLNYNTSGNVWQCTGLGSTRKINGNFTIGSACAVWLDNTTSDVSVPIGGNLTINGYLEVKRAPGNGSGNVNITVNGDVIVSGSTAYFYGIIQTSTFNYTGNLSFTCNNLTISSAAYFYGIYNGLGNASFNISGNSTIAGYVSTYYSTFYGIYANSSSVNYGSGICTFNSNYLTLTNKARFYGKYFNQIQSLPPPGGNFNSIISQDIIIGSDNTDCFYYGIYNYISGSTIYGLCSGDANLSVNGNIILKGTDAYFNFIGTNGSGSFNLTVGNTLLLNGGSLRGNSYAFIGNNGTTNLNINTLNVTLGSILVHSADVTDGRTCLINITNNATIDFPNSAEFFLFSNLTGGTQNQIYDFRVGGNLTITGNTSAIFRTRTENTSITDYITIGGNLTVSGGQLLLASNINNPLNCTIGGNVNISGGTINTSTHSSSKIDLTGGSSSVTWSQTGGTVNLCNTNIKPGKTVTLTGNKMGDFQSGRTLTVENGAILNCDVYPITGAGNFTLSNGATLGIGNINGIESSGATGNIQVLGTRTYNSNATYRYYGGQTPQNTGTFTTTSDPQIQYLVIDKTNNTDKVIINKGNAGDNSFTITGNLNLNKGGLSLNERTLIVSNGATSAITRTNGYIVSETNAATNNSKLQWNIGANTGAHVFPFGTNDGYYIPVTFNNSANVGNVTISTRPTNSDNTPWATGVTNMNLLSNGSNGSSCCVIDRWWDISVTNPASSSVTFSYLGRENTMTNPNSEIAIQHWTGSIWNNGNGGGSGTFFATGSFGGTSPTTTYSVTGTFNEFSPFILVNRNNPLPVEFIYFAVSCYLQSNILTWQTASESNNYGFVVQKSHNANEWDYLGFVAGQNNSNTTTSYQYIDNNPFYPVTYYRLLQTDNDGATTPSNVVSANCSNASPFVEDITPLQGDGMLNILVQGNPEVSYRIYITNVLGQVIYQQKVNLSEPMQRFLVEQPLAAGMYYINMIGNNNYISKPFVIHR